MFIAGEFFLSALKIMSEQLDVYYFIVMKYNIET